MEIERLTTRWNDRMLLEVCEPLPGPTLEAGSLLRPGASAEALLAAESRLGRDLPKSFREFLAFSNGANADWDLVTAGWPRACRSGAEVGLLPANEVAAAVEAVPEAVEMWADGWVSPNPARPRTNRQVVDYFEPLKEALLVSSLTLEAGKYFLCLVPIDSQIAVEPFELWDKGHDEITRYLTFGDWLELSVADCWHDPGEVFLRVNAEVTPDLATAQKSWPASIRTQQIRRLARCSRSPALSKVLDELWAEPDPYVRLAAAQVHRVTADDESRIDELTESDEASVALAALATLRVLG